MGGRRSFPYWEPVTFWSWTFKLPLGYPSRKTCRYLKKKHIFCWKTYRYLKPCFWLHISMFLVTYFHAFGYILLILHHLDGWKPINNGIIIILGGAGFCPLTVLNTLPERHRGFKDVHIFPKTRCRYPRGQGRHTWTHQRLFFLTCKRHAMLLETQELGPIWNGGPCISKSLVLLIIVGPFHFNNTI